MKFGLAQSIVVIGLLSSIAGAATLFQDDFSAGSSKWTIVPTGAGPKISTATGALSVKDTTPLSVLVIESKQSFPQTFTFTVTMQCLTAADTNVGIIFCADSLLNGYCLSLDREQHFMVATISTGAALCYLPSSSLNAATNVLTVSRSGGELRFFANGKLLTTITNSAYLSGKIGFFVPAGRTGIFDDVLVTDQAAAATPTLCFADDFADNVLDGWYTEFANGTASCGSGAARLSPATTDSGGAQILTDGSFSAASVRVVVSHQSGDAGAAYGIVLSHTVVISANQYVFQSFMFLINSSRFGGIKGPQSIGYTLTQALEPPMHGGSGNDTLTVVKHGSVYVFAANGITIDSASIPAGFTVEAAGVFAGPGQVVAFDDFCVGPGTNFTCPVEPPVRAFSWNLRAANNLRSPAPLFDPLGRRIAPLDYRSGLKSLPGGMRIVARQTGGVRVVGVK